MIGIKELAETIEEALDNVEGDFTDKQLQEVLEVMKSYPYICNKRKSESKYKQLMNKLKRKG